MSFSGRTVWEVLEAAATEHPEQIALRQPLGSGRYRTWSWREYAGAVREIAAGLRGLGIRKGDVVALQSETRAEFYLADLAVIISGRVAAALYTSLPYADQARTMAACQARLLIVENETALRKLREAGANLPAILLTPGSDATTIEEVREDGRRMLESDPFLFERMRGEYGDQDHAVLYMTSGATASPKWRWLTHRAHGRQSRYSPAVVSPQSRRFHRRIPSLRAHRAASGD